MYSTTRGESSLEEAGERLEYGDAFRRKPVRGSNRTFLGSAQVPVDEALRSAQDCGALAGRDLSLAESVTEFVEVEQVVAISTGWYQEVDVEVTDDESSFGEFDLDQIDVPPTFYWTLEHDGPGQLDALVKQQIAAIDGRPSSHLILGQDPYVVRDDLADPPAGTPLTRAMENLDILDEWRCAHHSTLSCRICTEAKYDLLVRRSLEKLT
jgi:hypothetical protein